MSAKSPQEKAAEQSFSRYGQLYNQINATPYGSEFASGPKYGAEEYRSAADSVLADAIKSLRRNAETNAATSVGNTTASLASQGITGGSVLSQAQNRARTSSYDNLLDNIERLNLQRLSDELRIMDTVNSNDLRWGQARLGAQAQKINQLLGSLGGQQGAMAGMDNTTWVDDLFAGLRLGSDIAGNVLKIPGIFGS